MARRKSAIRKRDVKPGFWDNEDLAELDAGHRLLFIGLWALADRDGRLEDRPRRIRLKLNLHDVDVEDGLRLLAESGFISRYCVKSSSIQLDSNGSLKLIQVNNFRQHQNIHPDEARGTYPPAPAESNANLSLGPSGPSGPSGTSGNTEYPNDTGEPELSPDLSTGGGEVRPGSRGQGQGQSSKQTPTQMIQDMAYTRDKQAELYATYGRPPWTPDQISAAKKWLKPLPKFSEPELDRRRAARQRQGADKDAGVQHIADIIPSAIGGQS